MAPSVNTLSGNYIALGEWKINKIFCCRNGGKGDFYVSVLDVRLENWTLVPEMSSFVRQFYNCQKQKVKIRIYLLETVYKCIYEL